MPSVILMVLKGEIMQSEMNRWEAKVNKTSESGCWEWTGAKYRKNYGHFRRFIDGSWVMYKAHRFSYEQFKNGGKKLEKHLCVCHTCDNPSCVNPEHLFVGTIQDNINDKVKKGRHKYGIKNGFRVLDENDVLKIKNDYATGLYSMKQVGEMNRTSASQVCRVVNQKTHRKVGTEN